jgi:ribonuclease Z
VTPDMVLESDIKGHGFAILDVGSANLVDALLQRPEFEDPEITQGIDVIYWNLSEETEQDSRIRDFMARHRGIKHVLMSLTTCANRLAFSAAAGLTIKMNRIDPSRFPLLDYSNRESVPPLLADASLDTNVAKPGSILHLAPRVAFDDDQVIPFPDTCQPVKEVEGKEEVMKLVEEAQARIADPAFLAGIQDGEQDIPDRETEVMTLGTGSALPSKYRNVSSTLLRVPGVGVFLFDCGENTIGQLYRMLGVDGTADLMRELRGIIISHMHADHHLGTVSIINSWRSINHPPGTNSERKLLVVAQEQYLEWMKEYSSVEDFGYSLLQPLSLGHPKTAMRIRLRNPLERYGEAKFAKMLASFGLADLTGVGVDHCFGSSALVLTFVSGLKVAYSGDCRPSQAFAEVGRGAHLLIHECTFSDNLRSDARAKKHSTISEALGVARNMGARRVMLTHFSQRYPKTAVMSDDARNITAGRDMAVLFGFDGMRVKLGEFRQAELFLPALEKLYEDDESMIEDKYDA